MADPDTRTQAQKDRDALDGGGSTGDPNEDARRRIQAQNDDAAQAKSKEDAAAAAAKAKADAAEAAAQAQAINSHFQYGGWQGGASEAANRYAIQGSLAQGRQGEQINTGNVNSDRDMNAGARQGQVNAAGAQLSMAGLLAARANGQMPSIAGMRANQDIGRALADQSSIAASARGPAGLALAQQQQANNSAAAMGNISNSAQINTAQEQLNNTVAAGQAYGAAGQSYTGMRGGDQALQGADSGLAISQAQLNQQQRAQNDQYQLGMTGYETGVQNSQLQAQGNQVAIAAGQQQAKAALAQNQNQFDSNRTDKYIGMGLGALGTTAAVGAALFSGGGGGGTTQNADPALGGGGSTGGYGNGFYGAPGSTPGGYDTGNGDAPMAGTGGGYDPDHPGDTSDITAKQNIRPAGGGLAGGDPRAAAWDQGHNEALNKIQQYRMLPPQELKGLAVRGDRVAAAVLGAKADAYDEGQGKSQHIMQGGGIPTRNPTEFQHGDPNDTTRQLANGLAPSTYDYKPGYGTPGEKFGPMAQNMAANPTTATAVRADPAQGGLMSIDRADGLKVALGGVGHLAQKQTQTEEELQRIKGLLAQQPSIGQRYLAAVRGGR